MALPGPSRGTGTFSRHGLPAGMAAPAGLSCSSGGTGAGGGISSCCWHKVRGPKEPQGLPNTCHCLKAGLHRARTLRFWRRGEGRVTCLRNLNFVNSGLVSSLGPEIFLYFINPFAPFFIHVFGAWLHFPVWPSSPLFQFPFPSPSTVLPPGSFRARPLLCTRLHTKHGGQTLNQQGAGLKECIIGSGRKMGK